MEDRLRRHRPTRILMAAVVAIALAATACDSGDPVSDDAISAGGQLKIAGRRHVRFLDPAAMYSSADWLLARGVFRTLVTYGGGTDSSTLVPDLATDIGTPNAGATQWTFKLKDGVRFGPALGGEEIEGVTGAEITTSDVKYAIQRLFLDSVHAGYPFYYDIIEGADDFAAGKAKDITGIQTPDTKTIIFVLTESAGDWPHRMAMPATSPVPVAYTSQFDSAEVSNYNSHVVATGPYFIQRWDPDQLLRLARNEQWDAATDKVRAATVDSVEWDFAYASETEADTLVPPEVDLVDGATLGAVTTDPSFVQQVITGPSLCTRFVWINTKIEPFGDVRVRKAVAFAIDRAKLKDLQGGLGTGEVATSVLPPGIGGHLPADQFNPFASKRMSGNITKAKGLMAAAGLGGGFSGSITLVGGIDDSDKAYALLVKKNLEEIGFSDVNMKLIESPKLHTDYYTIPSKNVAIGTSGGWCKDYNDASTFMDPLFSGEKILDSRNYNWGQINNKKLNDAIAAASELPPGAERDAAWAEANELATKLAVLIPWSWDSERVLFNETLINPVYNSFFGQVDWVVAGIKE